MTDPSTPDRSRYREAALKSKAWPFEEARRLMKRYRGERGAPGPKTDADGAIVPMVFETGYGPSGLPHIGTFNEVLRTTMVRRAYETLTGNPTRLIAFSDDMDGFRKVPGNVPRADMLAEHLHKPLTEVPDPFGTHDSFAAHNNAKLRAFLDQYGFEYEFLSSTEQYRSGAFDAVLTRVLERYGQIMDIMLPTLGKERQATYSPVMPISAASGHVLQVPVEVVDAAAGLVRFEDGGATVEKCVFAGGAKLQWKVDWAMRWTALGVDYEMYGKDLTDSGVQSGKIAKVLGGRKPDGLIYEMFLDANGEKISKSKGNGLSIEQWLRYGTEDSLAFYIYRDPKSAKQLHMGVIPRAVDDYFQFREAWHEQDADKRLGNPVHHVHDGDVPADTIPVTFGLLLNLAGVMGEANREQIWGYLRQYAPDADAARYPDLDELIDGAMAYHCDFIAPTLERRAPVGVEVAALRELDAALAGMAPETPAEDIQNAVYAVGKSHIGDDGFANLREWFAALYETLLGSPQGPRMGSFISLYGIANTRRLIAEALE